MKIERLLIIAVLVVFAVGAVYSTVWADPISREVHLKKTAQVWSGKICLQDLVKDQWIQDQCSSDQVNCCLWKMNGKKNRTFTRSEIEKKLNTITIPDISLSLADGADSVTVTQAGRRLKQTEIESKIVAAAAVSLAVPAKKIKVTSFNCQSAVYVPLARQSNWDVILPGTLTANSLIRIVSTNGTAKTLGWAHASIAVQSKVYVAKQDIDPMKSITPAQFALRKYSIPAQSYLAAGYFGKGSFPKGTRARFTLLKGQPLTAAAIEKIPSVNLGDQVTLVLRSDNLKISTKGIAEGSAAVGGMVTVQLIRYNRSFRGRLKKGHVVEVWL